MTLDQAARAARLPFVAGPVALMPDAHVGIGATIGSVIPTAGAVIPAAVGVDIGCGMIAAETNLVASDLPDNLNPLHGRIASVVPAGVGKGHSAAQRGMPAPPAGLLSEKQLKTAAEQFGSLGSGNHFVEVCLDERDHVWVMLHSGSRGVGNQLAQQHIERAKKLMKEYFVDLEDRDLAYLTEGTPEFDAYITAMLWAQDYAAANRARMMDATMHEVFAVVGHGAEVGRVNCHHNFSRREVHDGREMWITRKGAISAGRDDMGVIPGSMGTRSYVVRGRGNPQSYNSCSHGAGRRLSRGEARRTLSVETLREAMAGKAWNTKQAEKLLDEHPDSYKDIDAVMAAQSDLAEVVHTLRQVLNYKGA